MNPRVFEEGSLTLVINQDGVRLYSGTHEINYIKEINTNHDPDSNDVEIKFKYDNNSDVSLKIEENKRLVRTLPFIKVT